MDTIEVFYFKAWDHERGEMVTSKRAATLIAISGGLGIPLLETRREIDVSNLDEHGFENP